jgi:hypothetical protein
LFLSLSIETIRDKRFEIFYNVEESHLVVNPSNNQLDEIFASVANWLSFKQPFIENLCSKYFWALYQLLDIG